MYAKLCVIYVLLYFGTKDSNPEYYFQLIKLTFFKKLLLAILPVILNSEKKVSVSDFLRYEILFSADMFKMCNYSHRKISRFINKSLGSKISDIHMKREENAGGEALLHYCVPSP